MKPSRTLSIPGILLVLTLALTGCFGDGAPVLDKDDIRFAGFYSDFLQSSGVAPASADQTPVLLATSDIGSLLARHNLDKDRLARKMALYRSDPDRWELVLDQVRLHIRQKEAGGE